MEKTIANTIVGDNNGINFIPSGSILNPTSSANAIPEQYAITCSMSSNQLIYTSELNPYFVLPLLSGSNTINGNDLDLYIRYYSTASHGFDLNDGLPNVSSSIFITSSNSNARYLNINISLEESATTVRTATYNAITASGLYNINYSASLNPPYIIISQLKSGSLQTPTIYTSSIADDSFNYNIIKTGSGALNYRERRTVDAGSASFAIQMVGDDYKSIQMITNSSSFGGTEDRIAYYISSSGKMGIGTTDPKNDFDIKTDSFKIRSIDGTKEIEFGTEGQLKTRKFAGSAGTETTGSELVLSYSPGTFAAPLKASVGDIMGTIRWEDESFGSSGSRAAGTPMRIEGKITAVDSSGTAGEINYFIGNPSSLSSRPTQLVSMKHQQVEITGSLNTTGNITAVSMSGDGSGLTNISSTLPSEIDGGSF